LNYGQVKDQVLKLLNQYTRAGAPVTDSYNNQLDYLKRIPSLVNDALMEIATTARKIPAVLTLSSLPRSVVGDQARYELPEDFYQFVSGSVVTTTTGKLLHTNCFSTQGRKTLLVPKDEAGDYTISYYRYPTLLPENPDDGAELDNEPETHQAIPFYVASFLVAHDDAFLCSLFSNKYADKLAKMFAGITTEVRPVDDAYGFYG